ncbi:unnamed protein product [Toxocara canis]|uniref:Uncharacterized protein n=1 Tax=Toxocara canis TaxID=6265 RepID=A0A183UCF5_TOXCA|nr:unnamed protein product [Toxocara canis]
MHRTGRIGAKSTCAVGECREGESDQGDQADFEADMIGVNVKKKSEEGAGSGSSPESGSANHTPPCAGKESGGKLILHKRFSFAVLRSCDRRP